MNKTYHVLRDRRLGFVSYVGPLGLRHPIWGMPKGSIIFTCPNLYMDITIKCPCATLWHGGMSDKYHQCFVTWHSYRVAFWLTIAPRPRGTFPQVFVCFSTSLEEHWWGQLFLALLVLCASACVCLPLWKVLYSHDQLYIHICMQQYNNTIKTSGDSSLEKYTSHFIWKGSKGLRRVLLCERWVGDWTELQHIDPHSSGYNSISFPFPWAAQPGTWGPSLCWDMVLIPASSLQLTWTSCCRGYIITWCPPTSCKRHHSHSIQPLDSQGHPLISSTGCTCYLHRCISSFDSLARSEVNMQQKALCHIWSW